MGRRYVKPNQNEKLISLDAINRYRRAMSQFLRYDKNIFIKNFKMEKILNTPDDSDIGYFIECDLSYPSVIEKNKDFPFCPENKVSPQDKFIDYMNEKEQKQ